MDGNNQKKIVFDGPKDPNNIIEEILKKNSLEESPEDYIKKMEIGETPLFDAVYKLSKKLAGGEITETTFLSDIQKTTNISEQIAINILKDVKTDLLPGARTIGKDELIQEDENPVTSYGPLNQLNNTTDVTVSPIKVQPSIKVPEAPVVTEKTTQINQIKKPAINQPRRADTYREPIE